MMSTPETPPAGQQPPAAMPTPADAQAIFERAQQAATRAETAAQQLEAARTGASQETQARFPEMPADVLENISKATADLVVQTLEGRYELSQATPAAPASPAPTGTAPGAAAPGDAGPPAGGTGDQPPPGFRNLAHRILGY